MGVMPNKPSPTTENLNKLIAFRQAVYHDLGPARDALFELADAALLTPAPQSRALAALALNPVFRRQWPSVYEALQDGHPDRAALLRQYARNLIVPSSPSFVSSLQTVGDGRLLLAGDHTAWPRLEARTLRERTIEHQPNPVPGAKPITVGQGFSTVSWVPEAQGSWALPLLHERIPPTSSPLAYMAQQLGQVGEVLWAQAPEQPAPIVLLDAEYGCAPFVKRLAAMPRRVVCLARLRPNLVLRTTPPPYPGQGRPAVHGRKFKLKDARTWGTPTEELHLPETVWGEVVIRRWDDVHLSRAGGHPMTVIGLERPHAKGNRRDPRWLWLAWLQGMPADLTLAQAWPVYFRRYAQDHWYRFAKQSLFWTQPCLKTPEQAETWSDLMPLITWELWLARPAVADQPLPWQKPQANAVMTPGRVRQSLAAVFATIGTPAQPPKPRGKSPGWPKGKPRTKAPRYPIVRKTRKHGQKHHRKR